MSAFEHINVSTWKDRLEVLSKIGLTLIGSSYAIGLLVLNMHIRQYGVAYLNFVQLQYVMVGALWLTLSGATYFAAHFLVARLDELSKKDRKPVWKIPQRY